MLKRIKEFLFPTPPAAPAVIPQFRLMHPTDTPIFDALAAERPEVDL